MGLSVRLEEVVGGGQVVGGGVLVVGLGEGGTTSSKMCTHCHPCFMGVPPLRFL